MAYQIHARAILSAFAALCLLATAVTPAAQAGYSHALRDIVADTDKAAPTVRDVLVSARPAAQARDPYVFRGRVFAADEYTPKLPSFDIQVACTGAPPVVVQSQEIDETQVWEFDEDVYLGPGALPPTVRLLRTPDGGSCQVIGEAIPSKVRNG